jgi:hypothetical protein
MKIYKDGMAANADKEQLPALMKAGWSRNPEDGEKAKEAVEASEEEETPKVKPATKKTAPKRRKPIAKKPDSEE